MVGDRAIAEDDKLNAMDELMTDFGQVDIEALRVEIEKNEVDRHIIIFTFGFQDAGLGTVGSHLIFFFSQTSLERPGQSKHPKRY